MDKKTAGFHRVFYLFFFFFFQTENAPYNETCKVAARVKILKFLFALLLNVRQCPRSFKISMFNFEINKPSI